VVEEKTPERNGVFATFSQTNCSAWFLFGVITLIPFGAGENGVEKSGIGSSAQAWNPGHGRGIEGFQFGHSGLGDAKSWKVSPFFAAAPGDFSGVENAMRPSGAITVSVWMRNFKKPTLALSPLASQKTEFDLTK
jgi:hypothetical protein